MSVVWEEPGSHSPSLEVRSGGVHEGCCGAAGELSRGGSGVDGQHWLHNYDCRHMAKGAGQEWSRDRSCSSWKPMTWLKSAGWKL